MLNLNDWAERIPLEPDPGNTGGGKRTQVPTQAHPLKASKRIVCMLNYSYGGIMIKKMFLSISILGVVMFTVFASEEASDTLKKFTLPSITVTSTQAIRGETPVPFSEIYYLEFSPIYTTQDIPRILSQLPSIITFSQSGNDIGYSNLTMRGFNQRRISVLINGIPQNDPEDHNVYWIDFPDFLPNVQQIQIQRGAGLNNYGQAAIGGSINFNTGNYLQKKGVRLFSGIGWQEFGYEDKTKFHPNVSKFSIEFSSGLVNKYAFYGRLSRVNSLGYRNHSYAFLNSYFFSAARFDENFSTQVNIFGGPLTDGLVYNGLPKDFVKDKQKRRLNLSYWEYDSTGKNVTFSIERRKQEIEEFSQPHYEILNDWQISKSLRLLSALFYYTGDGYFDYDASWADTNMLRLTSEYGYNVPANPTGTIFRAFVGNKQGGWIPRIIWTHWENELTAGFEFRIHRSEHWGKIRYAELLPENYDPDSKVYSNNGVRDILSVFAREKLTLTKQITLSLEGQFTYQRYALKNEKARDKYVYFKDINGNYVGGDKYLFDIKYLFFNPRVGINYKLNEQVNFFGFVAYTSREPRMHNLYRAEDSYFGATPQFEFKQVGNEIRYDFAKPISKPERLLDIEIGSNFNLFNSIDGSLNIFIMDYKDELVKTGRLDIFGNPVEENIPKTRHIGFELELNTKIFDNNYGKLELYGNATFSKNEIIDFNFVAFDNSIISFKGNPISGFPEFMGNIRASYCFKNLFVSLTGQYVGEYRTDNYGDLLTNNPKLIEHLLYRGDYYYDNKLESYFVLNFDANYTIKNLGLFNEILLKFQVRNLLNKLYAAGAEGKEFFPAAERSFFIGIELGI